MTKVYDKYAAGKSMKTIQEVENDNEVNHETEKDHIGFEFNR